MDFIVGTKRYVVSINYGRGSDQLNYCHPFEGYQGNMKFLITQENTTIKELIVLDKKIVANPSDMGAIGGFGHILKDQKTGDIYFHQFPRMNNFPGLVNLATVDKINRLEELKEPLEYYDLEILLNELHDKILNFKTSVNIPEQRKADNETLEHLVMTNAKFKTLLKLNFPDTYIHIDINKHSQILGENRKERIFIRNRTKE